MGRASIRNMDVLVGDVFADEKGALWDVKYVNTERFADELIAVRQSDKKIHKFQANGFTHDNYYGGLVRLVHPQRLPLSRRAAYAAIDSERDYQDMLWGKTQSSGRQATDQKPGGERTIDEFILYISGYADKLKMVGATSADPVEKLQFVRKVAGLSVACMEQHGAPLRAPPEAGPILTA